MKKNEPTNVEEEKKLVWKMKDLPNAEAVSSLVKEKVITPEEARAILFKEEVKQSDEVEALKEMVHALQEMVKDLLSRQNNIQLVPYTKVIEVPARAKPYWDRVWMSSTGGTLNTTTSSGYNGKTVYTLSTTI